MIRLLQLLILVALAYLAWRFVRNVLAARDRGAEPPPAEFQPTARCARCDTHVPRDQLDAAGVCLKCRA